MTRINDYLWLMPHTPDPGDPPSVNLLQQSFNSPVVAALHEPLSVLGYELKSADVMVRLDERVDRTADTFYANVRFIRYLRPTLITRIHFEHGEWADFLPGSSTHKYTINLDRFLITDANTQQVVPQWEGRLHTRMSSREAMVLEHDGDDQVWVYASAQQLDHQIALFLDKFTRLGQPWLEDLTAIST